jgi:hypothetical protein
MEAGAIFNEDSLNMYKTDIRCDSKDCISILMDLGKESGEPGIHTYTTLLNDTERYWKAEVGRKQKEGASSADIQKAQKEWDFAKTALNDAAIQKKEAVQVSRVAAERVTVGEAEVKNCKGDKDSKSELQKQAKEAAKKAAKAAQTYDDPEHLKFKISHLSASVYPCLKTPSDDAIQIDLCSTLQKLLDYARNDISKFNPFVKEFGFRRHYESNAE